MTIDAGATALLVVSMDALRGTPVSGWITVAAPVEVQIYDPRLAGCAGGARARHARPAAERWQYRPATVDGVPVRFLKRVQVTLAQSR